MSRKLPLDTAWPARYEAQAGVQAEQMRLGFLNLAQSCRDEKIAEPRPMLQRFDVLPSLPEKGAGEQRRQIPGLIARGAPGLQALVLVPIEIGDVTLTSAGRSSVAAGNF